LLSRTGDYIKSPTITQNDLSMIIIYKENKKDYLQLLKDCERNTKRKKLKTLKDDLFETEYILKALKPQFEKSKYAFYLGNKYREFQLINLKFNIDFYNGLIKQFSKEV
jgi:predicted nucleotidyltransferase